MLVWTVRTYGIAISMLKAIIQYKNLAYNAKKNVMLVQIGYNGNAIASDLEGGKMTSVFA